jgi:hypothetical protein
MRLSLALVLAPAAAFCIWYARNYLAWRRRERERVSRLSPRQLEKEKDDDWWGRQW